MQPVDSDRDASASAPRADALPPAGPAAKQAARARATSPVLVPAFLPESLGGPGTAPAATDGNKLQAARLLGITRKTLRLRLRALGLSELMSAEGDEDDAP